MVFEENEFNLTIFMAEDFSYRAFPLTLLFIFVFKIMSRISSEAGMGMYVGIIESIMNSF